jgi:RNase adaptor protein for sRNA GlmZ degradation
MTDIDTTRITIRSFGYLHDIQTDLAPADITIDLRRLLADPAHFPDGSMLDLTGLDPAVRDFVFATPGALDLLHHLSGLVQAMDAIKPTIVDLGCAGGRHRSVALAAALADQLDAADYDVSVHHLHVHLPRVIR